MKETTFQALFAVLAGFFSVFCAAKDYDWFINSHKARFFVNLFGRDGARWFYGILGLALIILGLVVAF